MKVAVGASSFLLLLPVLFIAAALGGSEQSEPTVAAVSDIPPAYLVLYEQAAAEFGLPWQLLAAIGKVESDHGRDPASNQPNAAGAIGPMQFLPATFAEYSYASGNNDPSITDPHDAIFAAAAMLAANGTPADKPRALYAYNHADWYVNDVLAWAAIYASLVADAGPAADAAVGYALAQLGTPYLWGGEEPGGFDCSGLVQAAYQSAGIQLPRVAQDQYDHGPLVPDGQPLQAGDLVFFGIDTSHVDHVGIVVNPTEMIDAPHTGALVRIETFNRPDYLGAARPAA